MPRPSFVPTSTREITLKLKHYLLFHVGMVLVMLITIAFAAEPRSGKWPTVRKAYITAHPTCEACGVDGDLEVHHVRDFKLYPELELEPTNLITLCPRCHIVFGHLGDFKAFNPCVREDAARHLSEVKARPYTKADAAIFQHQFSLAP